MRSSEYIQDLADVDTITAMPPPRDKAMLIRVSHLEIEAFRRAAEAEEMKLSEWVRKAARERMAGLGISIDDGRKIAARRRRR